MSSNLLSEPMMIPQPYATILLHHKKDILVLDNNGLRNTPYKGRGTMLEHALFSFILLVLGELLWVFVDRVRISGIGL